MTTMEPPPPENPSAGPESDPADDTAQQVLAAAAAAVDPLAAHVDMSALDVPWRLLFVHAHPDDEAITTAATMAKYASEGARVTLVTCTLGEEGEILVDELRHLGSDREDRLGEHRIGELSAACDALGVVDHRFLGGPGRYRDSGMMGSPSNGRGESFWMADLAEATGELVAVLRETRPQVVVTYNERGDYGHPDHIRAHDVTVAAFAASGDPTRYPGAGEPWQPSKLYYIATPRSFLQECIDYARAHHIAELFPGPEVVSAEDLPFGVPDEVVTTRIDAREYFDAKLAAMRAHQSQIAVNGPFFALADGVGQQAWAIEHYQLKVGPRGPGSGPHGWEDDLLAGL